MTNRPPRTRDTLRALAASEIGLSLHGSILVREPIDRILRGVVLARSGGHYYVQSFVMPLYVRRDVAVVDLSIGFRLRHPRGGGVGFPVEDVSAMVEAVGAQALPYLDEVESPNDLANWHRLGSDSAADLEAKAYSLASAGRWAEANMALRRIIAFAPDDQRDFVNDWRQDAVIMLALVQSDMAAATRLLETWESSTRIALRI